MSGRYDRLGNPICIICGGPRSAYSGARCRRCFRLLAGLKRALLGDPNFIRKLRTRAA